MDPALSLTSPLFLPPPLSSFDQHPTQMDASTPSPSLPRYQNTCIPALVPPGVDPTSVDFRTFFPYIPNEVKHRKRTSRAQLKVLEEVFRKDTKPNAALRKKLAAELDMGPRAVQVRPLSLSLSLSNASSSCPV